MQRNYYIIDTELYHYNKNHSPVNGQFVSGGNGSVTVKKKKKLIEREGDAVKIDKEQVKDAAKKIYSGTKKAYEVSKSILDGTAVKTDKQVEDIKRNIINSGDARFIYENRHLLSKRELDEAITRINTEKQLRELAKPEAQRVIEAGMRTTVNTFANSLGTNAGQSVVKEVVRASRGSSVSAKRLLDPKTKEKEKIINSGDAKTVYKNRSKLSKKELDEAISRINTEKSLLSMYKGDVQTSVNASSNQTKETEKAAKKEDKEHNRAYPMPLDKYKEKRRKRNKLFKK